MTIFFRYWRRDSIGRHLLSCIRIAILLPLAMLAACAQGSSGGSSSRMSLGQPTSPPIGSILFCRQNPHECMPQQAATGQVEMTAELWTELRSVQRAVNRQFRPTKAREVAWHYAQDERGTCVQYALEKRRRLLQNGWPAQALQLATVVVPGDIGHLVLVVDTAEGDWVMDNLRSDVVRWTDLPYRWVARQNGASMAEWMAVATQG